ncbi:uncharacterized protein MELLADRAFT_114475 [Melampsora larici-populina 98AG31]|uniref:Uncharacterized protein n=1 Tax=Melampsora larici-populina (strain 98AG31 / pathotype 3-4-7) TaxID=747676 RepID=F4SDL7_MELLP|nr:uncharacterized protein MELLADRAFT_114475 [Melampsora larici-populina 98AG31]EGF97260.1 hypothetical protein MELLADRAFT_114475 [Melampsora larici-populina 98AG31]
MPNIATFYSLHTEVSSLDKYTESLSILRPILKLVCWTICDVSSAILPIFYTAKARSEGVEGANICKGPEIGVEKGFVMLSAGKKRRETCEVLGWEMNPRDPPSFVYKYVLPPPRCPTTTPVEGVSSSDGMAAMFNPLELISRLEKISRRLHPQLFSLGSEEAASSAPIGAHFGDDHQEHCSDDCPRFNHGYPHLTEEKNGQTLFPTSISSRHSTPRLSEPFLTDDLNYSSAHSSSLLSSPQSEFQVYQTRNVDVELGKELATFDQESWRLQFQEQQQKQKTNRMSLDFILSAESRYPSLSNIVPNLSPGYMLHMQGSRGPRPRLPSLKETVGWMFTESYDNY